MVWDKPDRQVFAGSLSSTLVLTTAIRHEIAITKKSKVSFMPYMDMISHQAVLLPFGRKNIGIFFTIDTRAHLIVEY